MKKHNYANTYKILCQQADNVIRNRHKNEDLPEGWTVVDKEYNPKSNFKGVLYNNGDQYALTFVGTDKKSLKDWGANAKMFFSGDSSQMRQAKDFSKRMQEKYKLTPDNTVSIGHSEGGTEATAVGLLNGLKTITFNPYGIWKSKYDEGKFDYGLVTNYRDPYDPVSKIHTNVGDTYIVPGNTSAVTPFGSVKAHPLDVMGELEKSMPKDEYKKENKFFLDKLSDAEVSREDIARFEPELFALYEDEINQRMMNNRITQHSQFDLLNFSNLMRKLHGGFYGV